MPSHSPLKTEIRSPVLQFQPLTLAHRGLVGRYVRRFPPQISEHTFANLFIWRDRRPIMLAEWGGALLTAMEKDGSKSLLGAPIGECDLDGLIEQLAGPASTSSGASLSGPPARSKRPA